MVRRGCEILATLAAVLGIASEALAYSDPAQFDAPALEAGGGGRFYTGSPADGYTCESCHSGDSQFRVTLSGVPERYVPGATYLIRVDWPESVRHGAALFELTDERGRGAGSLALPPQAEFVDRELCEPHDPEVLAAVAYRVDRARTIVAAADCGEQAIRAQWTAPAKNVGPVWLSGNVLSSNHDGEWTGDSVTTFSEPIEAFGHSLPANELTSVCSVGMPGTRESRGAPWIVAIVVWLVVIGSRRRSQVRRAAPARGRQRARRHAGVSAILFVFGCSTESATSNLADSVLIARGRAVEPWSDAQITDGTGPIDGDGSANAAPDAATRDAEMASGAMADAAPLDVDATVAATTSDAAAPLAAKPSRLVFRVTTKTQSGRYEPKNVGAIWIANAQGRGVKTLALWATLRIRYLPDYLKSNPMRDTVDVVTRATLPTHQAHEVTWNLKGADNQMVPDGQYSVQLEVTDRDAPGQTLSVPFTKRADAEVIKPSDTPYFANIELRYE
jgi:hypothetical protein